LSPSSDTPKGRHGVVISPWLPTPAKPFAGTFVVDFAKSLAEAYGSAPLLVHLDDAFRTRTPFLTELATKALTRSRARKISARSGASLTVPIPVSDGAGWLERMDMAMRIGPSIKALLRSTGSSQSPPDVHAHLGIMSGSLALNAVGRNRVFVYEHSAFALELIEADERAHKIYAQVMSMAAGVLPVNEHLATRIRNLFPEHANKVRVHPNSIDVRRFAFRDRKPPLTKLLYIGNLKPEKGTRRLVDALRKIRGSYEDVTLAVAGQGPDVGYLKENAHRDNITVLPPVPPNEVPSLLHEFDMLLHLSEAETFGLTSIEAVLTGMPVLVSETDGSNAVIRPIEHESGTIVDQPAGPTEVFEAYEELRGSPGRLDLHSARRHLEDAYDIRQVGRRLADLMETSAG
jgi:glycogen(starch) synthase